jgi:hypothetical protein
MTGSAFFPGGIAQRTFSRDTFLLFEKGPTENVTFQWATYYDAADQAGLSRLYGGIHVAVDDFEGRKMGRRLGEDSFAKVLRMLSTPVQGLDTWRSINYYTTSNSGDAADGAAPFGDSIANLMKYALGLSASSDATQRLPSLKHDPAGLAFEVNRVATRTDITYIIETTEDMNSTWTVVARAEPPTGWRFEPGQELPISESTVGPDLVRTRFEFDLPAVSSASRFFRMRVERR